MEGLAWLGSVTEIGGVRVSAVGKAVKSGHFGLEAEKGGRAGRRPILPKTGSNSGEFVAESAWDVALAGKWNWQGGDGGHLVRRKTYKLYEKMGITGKTG